MKNLRKFALAAAVAVVAAGFSFGVATVSAQDCTTDVQDEYTCYPVGEDETYCYYQCYCKVSTERCYAALQANGYEIY